ncbi:MAG: L,D-transpeptidase, partial [Haemophilus parahaemolyticus]|nr:L,D-transpeptidase [Haemophilus parahaemolyticus]
MKKFKLFPLAISLSAMAEQATLPIQQTAQQNLQIQQEKILPQLSFETQQARAATLAKDVNYTLEQEKIRQEQERKLAEAETRVKQEIGNNTLLLSSATAKVYLDNDFAPMWSDATATRTFLKEYALFAVSSVSNKA